MYINNNTVRHCSHHTVAAGRARILLIARDVVSRMTVLLRADVVFPQLSIILPCRPRPLTEMSNT